ncbi:MAG: potassium channel family protein [Spirochaetia bacterium]
MRQYAIIGLSKFGKRMLEELRPMNVEVLIVDKDSQTIEQYKSMATTAYIADALNRSAIEKIIPNTLDAAVIDFGGKIEVSILVTNYLKKIGIPEIIAIAETDEQGEILELVGATQIVFPNREAAKRITPILVSSHLFNYLPISAGLVIAEIKVPKEYIGKTVVEASLRKKHGVNVIAIRKQNASDYEFFSPEYSFKGDDVFLAVGKEYDINTFSDADMTLKRNGLSGIFLNLFSKRK